MRPPAAARRPDRTHLALRLCAIVALVFVVYGHTATFVFAYLDDDILIADNQDLLSRPGSLWTAFARPYFPQARRDHTYYRPIVNASFAADARWAGADPRGYHVTNVLLHAAVAALLFLLLRRLGYRDGVAFFGGLLFAVHPALTETVAWIPGRNDSLLALLGILAWLWLSRSASVAAKIGHLVALLGALLTKETAFILPAVYLMYLRAWERQPWRQILRPWLLGGWVAVFTIALAARAVVVASVAAATATAHTGFAGAGGLSLMRAIDTGLPLVLGGLGKLLLPVHLSVLAIPEDTPLWPGAIAAAAMVALAWAAPRRLPGARRARLLFGAACMFAFLLPGLPASNLLILENRLYLPAVGIVVMLCELAGALTWPARAKFAVAGALIALGAGTTVAYAANFRDRLIFAEAAVRQSPHSSLAHRNLGVTYQLSGHVDDARREYQAALAEDAGEPVAHNNLGVLFMAERRLPEAELELREELRLNPTYVPAHRNLAKVLRALGRDDEARLHWQATLKGNPGDADAL
ncbi:MAG: hypothetical protein ABUS79_28715, partial [Pseudomonadota bacterium]